MAENPEFELKINGFTPDSLPMERLAEYLAAMSKLMGSAGSVHFVRVYAGSATLAARVEDHDEPKVSRRLELVRMGGGVVEARSAYQKIDDMLAEDGTDGVLQRSKTNLIVFPGKARPMPETFGPVVQSDTIDGFLIGLGGKDETVPIHLQDGETTYKCNTTRSRAREMAPYIFGPKLRVSGQANWRRDADGVWRLNTMNIDGFLPLETLPYREVIQRLRSIEGNNWHLSADPYAELHELRGKDDEKDDPGRHGTTALAKRENSAT